MNSPELLSNATIIFNVCKESDQRIRPVVYLDETWCNAHHGKEKAWVEKDEVTGGSLGGIK